MSNDAIEVRSANADELVRLRREIAGLEQELQQAKADAAQFKSAASDSVNAIRTLRKVLDPFRIAIGMIYGEISRVDAEEASGSGSSGGDAKWVTWKQRLGGKQAEIIDLLLLQDAMTITQVSKAAHCHYDTAAKHLSDMAGQGILSKNGNAYSLKR